MRQIGLASRAQATRHQRNTTGADPIQIHKSEWMDSGKDPFLSPTVFLIEQPPNSELHTHWHGENQFQVFVQGSGSIGRDALGPYTVHYAGAYTGYGPIKAGDQGLSYFTLRAVYELGSKRKIEEMVRGPKRHAVGGPHQPLAPEALRALAQPESVDLIPHGEGGLCARVLRVPPGGAVAGLAPDTGAGQFYLILQGGFSSKEQSLTRWETLFLSSDEPPLQAHAGADGAEVLFLQLPPKEQVYLDAQAQQRAEKALAAA